MIRQKIDSKSPNFIGCWKIDNEKLFSDMINFFENNPQLHGKGSVSSGTDEVMKKTQHEWFRRGKKDQMKPQERQKKRK